jgi:hypothetical protein
MAGSSFEVSRVSPDRLDISFSGKLDAAQMEAALDALVREAEGIEGGRMLFRVGDYRLPSLAAVKLELGRLPSMLGWIRKFSHCAVLADQGWLRAISELEGALIPGLEIKGFPLGEEDAAVAWLSEASRE